MRQELNLTQQDLAVAMNTTVTSVGRWETSLSPRGQTLEQLARFAAERRLPEWHALFRRAIVHEQFAKCARQYFLVSETLDWQMAIAEIYPFREHPAVAGDWRTIVDTIARAHRKVLPLPKGKDASPWEVEESWNSSERLSERLSRYQKQTQKMTATTKPITKKQRKPT